ncbi:uracil-DNA glycosylase family protein [Nakamurella alba]|uniref:uracil-DNA glycosylase family protein n=1 Tax=Nakamurella alba TaxID=2665158 RepID=UPI001E4871A0|nr:hypothetical protein [Nakamurella alba]
MRDKWQAAGTDRIIPAFDPDGPGTAARLLVLLERPAPGTVAAGSDGVSSEDNDTASSVMFRSARVASGLGRGDYLRWNVIPWSGPAPTRVSAADLDEARSALHDLLCALPELGAIVALGTTALDGLMRYYTLHDDPRILPVLGAPHPSPANGRHRHEQHARIANALRRATVVAQR